MSLAQRIFTNRDFRDGRSAEVINVETDAEGRRFLAWSGKDCSGPLPLRFYLPIDRAVARDIFAAAGRQFDESRLPEGVL